MAVDLSTPGGIDAVAEICASEPLAILVNNAGVAHYMPLVKLSAEKAREIIGVKVMAPTMLARAAVAGMTERWKDTTINVAGMIAFSGPTPASVMPRRTVYAGVLAYLVAMSQSLSAELDGTGVRVQVLCPGVVATEFHERQGLDLSAATRQAQVAPGRTLRTVGSLGTYRPPTLTTDLVRHTCMLLLSLALASCAGQETDDRSAGGAESAVSGPSATPQLGESADTSAVVSQSPVEPSAGPAVAASEPTSCTDEVGASAANSLVQQCLDVSPATHPPCNAANSCALIRDEIARGCARLDEAAANEAGCTAPGAG